MRQIWRMRYRLGTPRVQYICYAGATREEHCFLEQVSLLSAYQEVNLN